MTSNCQSCCSIKLEVSQQQYATKLQASATSMFQAHHKLKDNSDTVVSMLYTIAKNCPSASDSEKFIGCFNKYATTCPNGATQKASGMCEVPCASKSMSTPEHDCGCNIKLSTGVSDDGSAPSCYANMCGMLMYQSAPAHQESCTDRQTCELCKCTPTTADCACASVEKSEIYCAPEAGTEPDSDTCQNQHVTKTNYDTCFPTAAACQSDVQSTWPMFGPTLINGPNQPVEVINNNSLKITTSGGSYNIACNLGANIDKSALRMVDMANNNMSKWSAKNGGILNCTNGTCPLYTDPAHKVLTIDTNTACPGGKLYCSSANCAFTAPNTALVDLCTTKTKCPFGMKVVTGVHPTGGLSIMHAKELSLYPYNYWWEKYHGMDTMCQLHREDPDAPYSNKSSFQNLRNMYYTSTASGQPTCTKSAAAKIGPAKISNPSTVTCGLFKSTPEWACIEDACNENYPAVS